MKIVSEKDVKPIHLLGRDVFNLITPVNTDCKKLSVGVDIIFPKAKTEPPHYHPKSEEIVYVIRGKLKIVYDNQEKEICDGDIVFIKPGTVHIFENVSDEEAKILFCFSPPVRTGDWIEAKRI